MSSASPIGDQKPQRRKISLRDKLGLDATASYVAFDFWNQKVLGVFSDEIAIDIEPHDTRVLAIHPLLDPTAAGREFSPHHRRLFHR